MKKKTKCRLCGKTFDRGDRAVPAPILGGVWQFGAGLAHPKCSREYKYRQRFMAWFRARSQEVRHAN